MTDGLLARLGASAWLIRHHELVLEAATLLVDGLPGLQFDRARVLAGAALHDAGKIIHPDEQHAPGHQHEAAGEKLLLANGVAPDVARFCVTHASWEDGAVEDLLVALADKLWKGKRDEALEARVVETIAEASGRERWDVFGELDALFEAVAIDGPERLSRSIV